MPEWINALTGFTVGVPIGLLLRELIISIEEWHGRHESNPRST